MDKQKQELNRCIVIYIISAIVMLMFIKIPVNADNEIEKRTGFSKKYEENITNDWALEYIEMLEERIEFLEFENAELKNYIESIEKENELTDEEWECLYRIARSEAGSWSKEGQKNVVYTVLNRVHSNKFKQDTIKEVIFAPGQFSVISNESFYKVEISDFTIENVKEAYMDYITGISADGALFFHSGEKTNTFNGADYIFSDEVGHHFYK